MASLQDSILPTSGSRGCTAAVVELAYNTELTAGEGKIFTYKGTVEFMRQEDWRAVPAPFTYVPNSFRV